MNVSKNQPSRTTYSNANLFAVNETRVNAIHRWRNRGGRMGLGPTFISGSAWTPTLKFWIIGKKVQVTQLILGPLLIKLFNEKNISKVWQYFVNILCNILFVIWKDFVIVWQNTPCTVYHPAMTCLPHWRCWTLLPDGEIQQIFFPNMV